MTGMEKDIKRGKVRHKGTVGGEDPERSLVWAGWGGGGPPKQRDRPEAAEKEGSLTPGRWGQTRNSGV